MDNLDTALQCASPSNPVLLVGPPGVGKSARVEAWAADTGRKLIIEHPVIAQSVDYRGLPAVVDGEAQWLPLGGLKEICAKDSPQTVVLLDDVGQAPPSVQAALMQLILARKLGDMSIHPDVTFILASNRASDRAGVRPVLSALINRVMVVNVKADPLEWAKWAIAQPDIDATVPAYVRFRPDCFVDSVPDEPMQPYCTPRSMHFMSRLVKSGMTNIEALGGWVGMATAADYRTFAENVSRIPSIDSLLADPTKVKGIKDLGMLHAIAALASRKAPENPRGVVALANAMGGGWGLTMISGAVAFHPAFKQSKAFTSWALANKNLL